jgi:hypothetical protein
MKIRTMALALLATGFTATAAMAQQGAMQPIPNPPEKAAAKHHMAKKKVKKAAAESTKTTTEAAPKSAEPK